MAELGAWIEFFRTLGIAAPFLGFVVFIYQKSDAERRETQGRFLDALQTSIQTMGADRQANTTALAELNTTIRERGVASTAEHEKMLQLIQRLIEEIERMEGERSK